MLAYRQYSPVTFVWEQFHKRYRSHQWENKLKNYLPKIKSKSGQRVKQIELLPIPLPHLTLRSEQDGCHFADNIFNGILLYFVYDFTEVCSYGSKGQYSVGLGNRLVLNRNNYIETGLQSRYIGINPKLQSLYN